MNFFQRIQEHRRNETMVGAAWELVIYLLTVIFIASIVALVIFIVIIIPAKVWLIIGIATILFLVGLLIYKT